MYKNDTDLDKEFGYLNLITTNIQVYNLCRNPLPKNFSNDK